MMNVTIPLTIPIEDQYLISGFVVCKYIEKKRAIIAIKNNIYNIKPDYPNSVKQYELEKFQ